MTTFTDVKTRTIHACLMPRPPVWYEAARMIEGQTDKRGRAKATKRAGGETL